MTSFEKDTNPPLVSQKSADALDAHCKELKGDISPEVQKRREELLASAALAEGRMDRESDQIVGTIDVKD